MIHTYKELVVWKKSVTLATLIYKITEKYPRDEIFGLSSQMRRASISISSNIAEGRTRGSRLEFIHFLNIAHGSCAELESQLFISNELKIVSQIDFKSASDTINELMKMLGVMISKLRKLES